MRHLVSAASPEMPSSLGGEGRRRVVEGEVGRGEEVLEFWRWMAGRWATMNQVKHGRRRHGPVRTCPVQGRASRKDNYVFRSDRRISARLGHDTDSSRLRARCLRVNVQRSSVNSLSPVAEEFRFLTKSKSLRFMYAMGRRMLRAFLIIEIENSVYFWIKKKN